MKIWMVSREYSGLAESGGVKNVVCSLSEKLVEKGHEVTFFMPFYGCTDVSHIENYVENQCASGKFLLCGKETQVTYSTGFLNGVKVVLIGHTSFSEKNNVYTYCLKDRERFPDAKTGTGYADDLFLNVLLAYGILHFPDSSSLEAAPDLVHCHDACPAIVPPILRYKSDFFSSSKFVVTIHNAGPAYHHEYENLEQARYYTGLPDEVLLKALNGSRVEPYLLASLCSALSTVSDDYGKELLVPGNEYTDGLASAFVERNVKITGITNGIDAAKYKPEDKNISLMPYEFSPSSGDFSGKIKCRDYFMKNIASKDSPEYENIKRSGYLDEKGKVYFSYHGRLVRQKGIFILLEAVRQLLEKNPDVRFIINGQGEEILQNLSAELAEKYPGRFVYFKGYDKKFSRLCIVSGDFAVLPSTFEPCGLEDFIAQLFGTIPVAHSTGGLKKILDGKTGFLYEPNTPEKLSDLMDLLSRQFLSSPEKFREIAGNASSYVQEKYSWENVVEKGYLPFYKSL